jgi:2-polyprenyl-3-methyl-5-hydroxy-6-metoxy-1,4-benzoquinol methylase
MEKRCILCSSKDLLYFFRKEKYNFLKCKKCGLVFVYPRPNLKLLISDFYSKKSGYHSKLNEDLNTLKRHNKKFVKIVNELVKLKLQGNLLDVGCSNGEFLFLAKKKGFKTFGVEVNENTADIAANNGLEVFNGTLSAAKFKNDYFSVVYLGDVIEHVINPVVLIKECQRILKIGGVIVISTPNMDCFWVKSTELMCRLFKFPWSTLLPPYHLFVFSASNLKKFICGLNFKILEIKYYSCSLRHELSSTRLLKEFLKSKSAKILFYTILVFLNYTAIYLINFLVKPFLKKDFEMLIFAAKK